MSFAREPWDTPAINWRRGSFVGSSALSWATAWVRWSTNLHAAAQQFGKNMRTVRTWPDKLKDAGFENVQSVVFPVS